MKTEKLIQKEAVKCPFETSLSIFSLLSFLFSDCVDLNNKEDVESAQAAWLSFLFSDCVDDEHILNNKDDVHLIGYGPTWQTLNLPPCCEV